MNLLYKIEDAVAQAVSLICIKLWLWLGISKKMQAGVCCIFLAYSIILKITELGAFNVIGGMFCLIYISFLAIDSWNGGTYSRYSNRVLAFYTVLSLDAISMKLSVIWFYYVLIVIAQTDFPPRKPLGRLSFSGA